MQESAPQTKTKFEKLSSHARPTCRPKISGVGVLYLDDSYPEGIPRARREPRFVLQHEPDCPHPSFHTIGNPGPNITQGTVRLTTGLDCRPLRRQCWGVSSRMGDLRVLRLKKIAIL